MRRLRKAVFAICLVTVIALVLPSSYAFAAQHIEIDDDEYNLLVDEYPDGIGEGIYAKTKNKKSDIDDYYLNLSSDDSEPVFEAALKKSGIGLNNRLTCSMDAALYKVGEDDDKKVTDAIELLLPLPDDIQEHPEEATLYQVSGGSAKPVNGTLVECDDVYYIQFSLSSYTTYGFVYTDPEVLEEEDEDEDEDEDEEPTVKPTAKPTATPTKAPTAAPTKKPTAAPTKKPSSQSGASGAKDAVPKTGDEFPLEGYLLAGTAALGGLIFAVIKLRK